MKVHEFKRWIYRFSTRQALGGHKRKHAELSAKRKREDGESIILEASEKKRMRVGLQLEAAFNRFLNFRVPDVWNFETSDLGRRHRLHATATQIGDGQSPATATAVNGCSDWRHLDSGSCNHLPGSCEIGHGSSIEP